MPYLSLLRLTLFALIDVVGKVETSMFAWPLGESQAVLLENKYASMFTADEMWALICGAGRHLPPDPGAYSRPVYDPFHVHATFSFFFLEVDVRKASILTVRGLSVEILYFTRTRECPRFRRTL